LIIQPFPTPLLLRLDILDCQILGAIAEVLQARVFERAVEKTLTSSGSWSTPWQMARSPLTRSMAPTGFGRQASLFEIAFQGLALTA
jgi:hypothetical protein